MSKRRITEDINIDISMLDIANWPTINIDKMNDKQLSSFNKKKIAVEMYMKNEAKLNEISKITGVEVSEIRRYVKRCLSFDENGQIWGYRGLIFKKHIAKYDRKKDTSKLNETQEISYTGAFSQLLEKYPQIKEKIITLFLNQNKEIIIDPIMKGNYIHKYFIKECEELGLRSTDYPFNTVYKARRSLYNYLNYLENEYFGKAAKRYGEDASRRANSTGIGDKNRPLIIKPFEQVQFDGHKIDLIITIKYTTPDGDEHIVPLQRMYLLVIIDVATRVILGHHLCLSKEYSAADVLKCIQKAINPKKLYDLTIPGLKYPIDGGYASYTIPEAEWAIWNEFCYDNAKANLAENVRNKLTRIVGCAVNPGPVKMPERRAIIERFFGILEENGFHRLPSTTGCNVRDPRRKDAEVIAIKNPISVEHLEELTDVLIANYNCTPHGSLNYKSPIDIMKQKILNGNIPRYLPAERRNDISFLSIFVQRVINGNIETGRRPYINFLGVEYRNEVLSRSPHLIGTKLDLLINIEDIRNIKAYLPDGSEFGVLTASGKWGIRPHSMQVRKEINKLIVDKIFHFTFMDDPIEVYQKYLQSNAKNNKAKRNKLAKLEKELKKGPTEDTTIKDDISNQSTNCINNVYSIRKTDKTSETKRRLTKTIIC